MLPTDNITILRFAQVFSSGGGIETYMDDIDKSILSIYPWTIIRFYITKDKNESRHIKESIGRGFILRIPLYSEMNNIDTSDHKISMIYKYKKLFTNIVRDNIIYNRIIYNTISHKYIGNKFIPGNNAEANEIRRITSKLVDNYNINLFAMHHVGVRESAGVILEAVKRRIPYIVINHFSNDRFNYISVREQTKNASGIGGVSKIGVPRWLNKRFFNLSDGVDTDFFQKSKAKPLSVQFDVPIVLLPARITPGKGQKDLFLAYAILKEKGVRIKIILIGRDDSSNYIQNLKQLSKQIDIEKDVSFIGELPPSQVRDWYAAASILVFPTYSEGLGRVLLEAQSMNLPIISYNSGGTSEAILHGETGILVKRGNVRALAESLRILLTNNSALNRLKAFGRIHVEKNFNLNALAERHVNFYIKSMMHNIK